MNTLRPLYGVLALLGTDRIGIIATATEFLRGKTANICSTFASKLGQVFCLNVYFAVPDREAMERIRSDYEDELGDFAPTLVETGRPVSYRDPQALHYDLTVMAYDHEGIVADTAQMLAAEGVDIVSLAGCTYRAGHAGTDLFVAEMKLDVPNAIAVRNIRKSLLDLERHKGWDIDFRPMPRADLEVNPAAMYPPSRAARVDRVAPWGSNDN